MATNDGVAGFVIGLAAQQIEVEERGGLLVYRLMPLAGTAAGRETETGVAVDELGGWPAAPPHWVHVPDELHLAAGGAQPSELAGWSRYSRPHPGRLDASATPGREWIAHVRALLGTAT